jgi:hypothetical protein
MFTTMWWVPASCFRAACYTKYGNLAIWQCTLEQKTQKTPFFLILYSCNVRFILCQNLLEQNYSSRNSKYPPKTKTRTKCLHKTHNPLNHPIKSLNGNGAKTRCFCGASSCGDHHLASCGDRDPWRYLCSSYRWR